MIMFRTTLYFWFWIFLGLGFLAVILEGVFYFIFYFFEVLGCGGMGCFCVVFFGVGNVIGDGW